MKFIAGILLILLSVLVIQPVVSTMPSDPAPSKKMECAMQGCGEKQVPKPQPAKDCCRSNCCNPFMNCALGIWYMPEENIGISFLRGAGTPMSPVDDHRLSYHASDCWRPPRA